MALSAAEQNKVLQLLGYGGKTARAGSVIYNRILNDRLHQLPLDTEAQIRTYLASITTIETQMAQAPGRLVAASVDDVKMNLQELQMLRAERKNIAKEIAVHLDIPYKGPGGSAMNVSV